MINIRKPMFILTIAMFSLTAVNLYIGKPRIKERIARISTNLISKKKLWEREKIAVCVARGQCH